MKCFATTILLFVMLTVNAQKIKMLDEVESTDLFTDHKTIIYGSFIQRLGFSSGGFVQHIRLINVDTKEIFAFVVKPAFKSAKENTFAYYIKPGNYAILNYWWTQSKWYGGQMYTEPIFKGVDTRDSLKQKIEARQIDPNELKPFAFTIDPNTLNYVGAWNFEKGIVSFVDQKAKLDVLMKTKFRLDFSLGKTVLPN